MAFKIEVGKWYEDGHGKIVKIVRHDPRFVFGYWSDDMRSFREDGQNQTHHASTNDLIREAAPQKDADMHSKFDRDQMAWEIYRGWKIASRYDATCPFHAYEYADSFLAEMAKQHEAKQ